MTKLVVLQFGPPNADGPRRCGSCRFLWVSMSNRNCSCRLVEGKTLDTVSEWRGAAYVTDAVRICDDAAPAFTAKGATEKHCGDCRMLTGRTFCEAFLDENGFGRRLSRADKYADPERLHECLSAEVA